MNRNAILYLKDWYIKKSRKPLVIRGARQVGKTYAIRDFADRMGLDLIEVNFEKQSDYEELFRENDPRKIIRYIEIRQNRRIDPFKSLLFLDEIQVFPKVLAKLRWFYEEMPELGVVATGSLLDFVLAEHSFSMPVGRIEYCYMEPFSFEEFLNATGKEILCSYLLSYNLNDNIPGALHNDLMGEVKNYMIIGGMPAAINVWNASGSYVEVNQEHRNLLTTYREDFNKYNTRIEHKYIDDVINSIKVLLGKKCKYSLINKDVQSVTIKNALSLLQKARICHKIVLSKANNIPLASEVNERFFKLIFIDTGLVTTLSGINDIIINKEMGLANQGGLSEQLVGQLLRTSELPYIDPELYFWESSQPGSEAEVDYLMQYQNRIIPIEVKSGSTGSLKSLHSFMHKKSYDLALRINSDVPSVTDVNVGLPQGGEVSYKLLSIPFYLVGQVRRLLGGCV